MKAIQVSEPGKIDIIEKDMPEIKENNEVLIKIKAVGICGSDMHIYHGTNPMATYPRIIGHEFTGEVQKLGSEVSDLKVGDRVVVEPIEFCGECYACKSGRSNVCESLEVLGVHKDGGMQEYIVVPHVKVHKIDNFTEWEKATMVEPFTIAAQSTWRGNVKKDDYVLIMGAGPIGLGILQYSKHKGAICIVTDINDEKLEFAKELGADHTINVSKKDVVEEVFKITDNMGANVTLDTACLPRTFEQCVEVASPAGRVVVLGFSEETSNIPQVSITKKELTIVGSRLETDKFPEVIDLFNKGVLNPEALVTHKFDFKDIKKAIEAIEDPEVKTNKVVVTF